MAKTKAQILKERKEANRTFLEGTSLGKLQDRITELELKVEDIEKSN